MKCLKKRWAGVGLVSAAGLSLGFVAPLASAAPASAPPATLSNGPGVVSVHVSVNRAAILKWWTPARMAAAKNVDVITAKAPRAQAPVGKGRTRGTPGSVPGHAPANAASVATATSGAAPTGSVSFTYPFPYTSWNVTKSLYTKYPYSVNGKIFFRNDGGTFVCSGTVIPSHTGTTQNEVWTAGHCLANTESLTGVWDTSLEFVPAWHKSKTNLEPLGVFTWTGAAETTSGWYYTRNLRVDEAAFTVNTNGTGSTLGNVTGWAGFAWNWSTAEQFVAFGFPQAKPYNGNNEVIDLGASAVTDTGIGGSGPAPIGIGNPMTGGSSGGGWMVDWTAHGTGYVDGHNDYKYTSEPLAMYSPYQTTLSNTVRCFGATSC